MAAETSKPSITFPWASGGAIVAPSDVKIQTGWTAEVPPFQWENYLQNRQDSGLLHLFQKGISVWSATENYYFSTNGERSYVQGSNGTIYVAVAPSLNQNPVTDVSNTYWKIYSPNGSVLAIRQFTATTAYVPTIGTRNVYGILVGGGGAGGGAPSTATGNTAAGLGGSAGGLAEFLYPVSTFIGQTINIGVGGAGVSNAAGGAGSNSTFAGITAFGGAPGGVGANTTPPWLLGESGNSTTPTGGNIANIPGPSGGMSFSLVAAAVVSGRGGSGRYGTGGNSRGNIRGNGQVGIGFGAGGGGAVEASAGPGGLAGGNGTNGICILWELA
jgi:hypothetical protein